MSIDSLDTLYIEHNGWLRIWLGKKLGCSQQAADLAQDTFLRILSKETMPSIDKPRAYLSIVAHGLVINHWQRQSIEQAYLQLLATQALSVHPSEEKKLLEIEKLQRLAAILDGLPLRCKQVFLLSRLEGLSYAEISNKLNISVNMVQKAMSKAMANCYHVLYE